VAEPRGPGNVLVRRGLPDRRGVSPSPGGTRTPRVCARV